MQAYYHAEYESTAAASAQSIIFLRPEQIQMRKAPKSAETSPNAVIRLAESIKKYGILEPLTVKPLSREGESPRYELLAGERRLRAAILLGLDRIPCTVAREDSRTAALFGILRSLQSRELNMFEQAAAFRVMMSDFSLTQEEIARKTGLSQSAVANKLRLLQLSHEEQQQILTANLTERHARAVLRLKTSEQRAQALYRIRAERRNVAATEELVDELLAQPSIPKERVFPQNTQHSAPFRAQETPCAPTGTRLRKFALQDLTPLYNSIERSLSIFRQTGATAVCTKEEGEHGARIVIDICKTS